MNRPQEQIADRLKEARELAGLSQAQVAEKLELHRPTISQIESGKRNITAEEIQKFCKLYGVRSSWVLGEEEHSASAEIAAREIDSMNDEDREKLLNILKAIE